MLTSSLLDLVILAARTLVGVGFVMIGTSLFAMRADALEQVWAAIFLLSGLFVLMGVVLSPLRSISIGRIWSAYLSIGGDTVPSKRQSELFKRLSYTFFLLAFLWLAGSTVSALRAPQTRIPWLGENTTVGIALGGSILFGVAMTLGVIALIIRVRPSGQGRDEKQRARAKDDAK